MSFFVSLDVFMAFPQGLISMMMLSDNTRNKGLGKDVNGKGDDAILRRLFINEKIFQNLSMVGR
jgi:hypothetical protein